MNKDQTHTPHNILVIGALGQIGSDLTAALRTRFGKNHIVAADIRKPAYYEGPFVMLDVTDKEAIIEVVQQYAIKEIYHLAAILSAKGERNPQLAWEINMKGLLNILDIAKEYPVQKVFWPSSIAVFGPNSPKQQTPQYCVTDPTTVYGISKLAGERWCEYYFEKYGVDVRSLRYPGLISYKGAPGGGTTDYAVEIYHHAVKGEPYTGFLSEETALPMMYMPDAIRATIELMCAPAENIQIRSSYNLAGMSFTPAEVYASICQHVPSFQADFEPDFRQLIADSWPSSIDDSQATQDWGWEMAYDLEKMTTEMLAQLQEKYMLETVSS
ncbi:MAG: NAD-dependent epimerase/dehydratase family protein [Bacteroidota bacterium]